MRATWLATAISLGAFAEGKLGVATRQFQAISYPEPIRGVNIGGWLVAEEWITPSLFSGGTVDEWTLCASLGKSNCRSRLEDHWQSFFTFDDFVDIRNAGLNSVRIPIGYWAVDVQNTEPYVSGQYPYLIQAVQWARSLDLTVLIDLHGAPGSQNGYDHSGRIGPVGFADNSTNEDRTIAVIRNLTAEFTQDIYGGAVKSIQLLNEPRLTDPTFTMDYLKQFYAEGIETALSVNRSQVNVTIHDAFWGPNYWSNYDPSNENARRPASNIVLDTHQYYAFEPNNNLPHEEILQRICDMSQELKSTSGNLLPQIVGEWSLESGRPPNSSRPSYGDTQAQRTWYRLFFEAQLAAYTPNGPGQPILGFYFWTWKTQYEIDTWSYRRGVAQQYIPSDISNSSTYVFPILENGCVDAGFNYTAPRRPGSGGQRAVAFSPLILLFVGFCATIAAWAVYLG